MATDKQLIQQILLGRSEAFGELFRKYQKQIYSICQGIVNNSHDAEDLVQESFVHAYLKLDQLQDPDKFFPWLKKIAQNLSKNYLCRKRVTTVPLAQVSTPITCNTPDRLLLRRELRDAIIEAIESLPQKDRDVIRAHIDGLSHSEISKQLGISIQASKDRLYRVRKKIKTHLKSLLNAIFGLPNMPPFKKIISGGMEIMKIGASKGVTTGFITATQSLMFSVIFHIALFISLSFFLPHKFHSDRQKVDVYMEVAIIPTEKQQSTLRPSKEAAKSVVSVKSSFSPINKESPSKAPRGFLSAEKPVSQGEIGETISRVGQGMFTSFTDAKGLRRELQLGAGVTVKSGKEMVSGGRKGGELLSKVGVERKSVSEVGKVSVGLAGEVGGLAKGRGDMNLEMKKLERFKPVIPQRGKFGKQTGLSMLGDTNVADADDTLANVAKDIIMGRTEFGAPELPKGEPGGIIVGRGKEIEGRLRFGRLNCSMIDESLILKWGIAGVLNHWIKWINGNTNIKVDMNVEGGAISLTDANLFKSPILFLFGYNEGMYSKAGWYTSDPTLTGYSRWTSGGQAASHLSSKEREHLRKYLVEKGGVLFVDTMPRIIASYYGNQKTLGSHYPWSMRMKRELRTILPEYNFQNIENEHKLYHCFYDLGGMTPGLPKTKSWTNVESDFFGFRFSPSTYIQGISIDGKLALIYSENASALMANNYTSSSFDYLSTKAAFRFLTNVVVYGLTHSGISDKSRYVPAKEIPEDAEEIPKKPPFIPPPTPNLVK